MIYSRSQSKRLQRPKPPDGKVEEASPENPGSIHGALAQLVGRAFGLLLPLGPQNSSFEDSLQTRRRKTRETPPESLRDPIWGISTVGSARHSHCRGQGFDSPMLHTSHLIRTQFTVYMADGLAVVVAPLAG